MEISNDREKARKIGWRHWSEIDKVILLLSSLSVEALW